MGDGKVIRWNNKKAAFELVAVDALDEKKHDIGNSKPTRPNSHNVSDIIEAIAKARRTK